MSGRVVFTTRVVDYEPPPARFEACPVPPKAAVRRTEGRRRRVTAGPAQLRAAPDSGAPAAAQTFADAALRCVLEVMDRRRPIAQLRPLMPTPIFDVVASLTPSTRERCAAAVLRRVRLRAAGADLDRPQAAEVFATYSRGNRVGAIAARVEIRPTSTGERWQLVALHLG
ncbi:MAG: Rv3235 family protein [Mycobacterium sp.]